MATDLSEDHSSPQRLEDLPLVLTVEEFAKACRIGRSTAYAAVRSGAVPGAFSLGRAIRIPRSAVAALLGETPPREPPGEAP